MANNTLKSTETRHSEATNSRKQNIFLGFLIIKKLFFSELKCYLIQMLADIWLANRVHLVGNGRVGLVFSFRDDGILE